MTKIKRIVIENLTTRLSGYWKPHNCVRLTRSTIPARWLGLSGIATPANRGAGRGSISKLKFAEIGAIGITFLAMSLTIGPFIMP